MKKIEIILKKQNDKNEIYEEIVEFDENIEKIDLSYKNLIEIPKGLDQFKQLKQLYLNNNQITKIENLDNNIDLTDLNLNNNKITKIENLDKLVNLQTLFLSLNKITKIENIDKNINLQELYLYDNQINKIENLDKNINLKILYLQNNQINKIENLDNLINLIDLYLSNNKISKIENIHHLDKLKYFRLFDEDQNENIKESLSISLDNYNLELKEIQIQKEIKEELLKQQNNRKLEKEYFDNNFDKIKQQFITSINISNDNELII